MNMSVQVDQVASNLATDVSKKVLLKQNANQSADKVSKVLLETEIVDDDGNEEDTSQSEPQVTSRMSDVPVEFIANYNTITSCGGDEKSQLISTASVESLATLYTGACNIWSYASEYDYSPAVPHNGFRTFLKVVFSYFDQLSLYVRLINFHETSSKEKKRLTDRVNDFLACLPLMLHQLESVQLIRSLKTGEGRGKSAEVSVAQVTDDSLATELAIVDNQLKLTRKDMEVFLKKSVYGFWLPESVRKWSYKMLRIRACITFPWTQGLGAFFSEKKLAKLAGDIAINWSCAEMKKVVAKMPKLKPTADFTVTKFNLEKRQYNWIIEKDTGSVLENVTNESSANSSLPAVRLEILKPKLKQTDRVIVHIHGGGWVIGSPNLYYNIMGGWIKEIGATIVSIDYSLSPEVKWPVALQEILDTYLWLASASTTQTVLEPLGFVPQELVVTGDSAGGNFTVALAVVLAEIIKKSSEQPKLPRALVPVYPAASPGTPHITASSSIFDVILQPLQRCKMGMLYRLEDLDDSKVSYLNGKNNPWFADPEKYKDAYKRVNGHKKGDPLFHLITYDSYDLLKNVPMYVQAAEFDPLIDDAVDLAKQWKGEVVFDVLPDAVHGYMNIADFSPECKSASDKTLARLKEAIGK